MCPVLDQNAYDRKREQFDQRRKFQDPELFEKTVSDDEEEREQQEKKQAKPSPWWQRPGQAPAQVPVDDEDLDPDNAMPTPLVR